MILRIAFRNLLRNKRRTLITTGAMSFALIIMIIYTGLSAGFMNKFEHNAVALDIGWIQIHKPGYREDPSIYKWVENTPEVVRTLEENGYEAVPRYYGYALAAANKSSAGVQLRGIQPEAEKEVTELYKYMLQGEWLSAGDEKGVVIGRKLAENLDVGIGHELVLLGQAADGSIANDLYFVRGIMKTVSETIDRSGFFMNESAYRKLMVYDGGAHQIVLKPPAELTLEGATEKASGFFPELDVKSWKEIAVGLSQMLDSAEVSLILLYIIAYAAIGMVTLNAMLMAVFERIREFGIMKAIGLSPVQIGMIILVEATFQLLCAGFAGVLAGLPTALYMQTHGIDFAMAGDRIAVSGIAMDSYWTTYVTPETVIKPIIFMSIMVFIAVLYPGIKAALVSPIKAIYHR